MDNRSANEKPLTRELLAIPPEPTTTMKELPAKVLNVLYDERVGGPQLPRIIQQFTPRALADAIVLAASSSRQLALGAVTTKEGSCHNA